MANEEHLDILKHGIDVWNRWREEHPGVVPDLTGADLEEESLVRVVFREADLSGADLSGTFLVQADLAEACLWGADLRRADLRRADLTQANLQETDLRAANLSRANLEGADLAEANLEGAYLSGANFRATDFSRANLEGTYLFGANFQGADLSGANLRAANLERADLRGADLQEAYLQSASLKAAFLQNTNLQQAILVDATLQVALLIKTQLQDADLRGADLQGANLREANLQGANLQEAQLQEANLQGASLLAADLRHADLHRTNLTGVDFRETTLADSDGSAANLSEAILTGAKLTGRGEGGVDSGFLELANAVGLETADFDKEAFLSRYLAEAFKYAHEPDLKEAEAYPTFVEKTIENIKLLRSLIQTHAEAPPPALVKVVQTITAELIKYLKAYPKELYQLRPRQFEELIAEILASYGWEVKLTAPTKDGGYDIYAISPTQARGIETSWIIECKKYAAHNKVGIDIARALYGTKLLLHPEANAMLATTSHFTKGVHDLKASRYDLALRDYEGVLEWINEYKPNPNGRLYVKDNRLVVPGDR